MKSTQLNLRKNFQLAKSPPFNCYKLYDFNFYNIFVICVFAES